MSRTRPTIPSTLAALFVAGALSGASAVAAQAPPDWAPSASEQLIKLPGDYLRKAVDNDFARSGLATALSRLDREIALKRQTLGDLRNAIDRADSELKIELRHQFLEEKRNYIALMKQHQDLRRRRAETKVRLYERLLAKLNRSERAVTPRTAELVARQTAARERFEASAARIDASLLRSTATSESKYAREYARNLAAIDSLVAAVNAHPMNQAPQIDGRPIGRGDYVRGLIAENQADIAIVDQERAILGYMAKLVSLDALALSDGIQAGDDAKQVAAAQDDPAGGVADAIDYFVKR